MNPLKRLRPLIFILFFMSIALPKARGFAPAGATKGLSGRPLETFGSVLLMFFMNVGQYKLN